MKGIRWKIITAIMIVVVAVCAIFIRQLIRYSQINLAEKIAAKEANGRILTQTIMDQLSQQYQTRIKGFVNYKAAKTRKEYIKAFARRDRAELLRLIQPLQDILKKENSYFASLAFILPDDQMFLRVWQPGFYGDDVSSFRPDIAFVNKEHRQVAGFNVGPYGMQYRVVEPVFYEGRYLGAVQFGIKASLLLDTLQDQLNVPTALAVRNAECKDEKFSPMPKLECANYSVRARDISLFQAVREGLDFDEDRQRVAINGKHYVLLNALALNNFQSQSLGKVILTMDISKDLSEKRTLIISTISIAIAISLVSFLILYFSIGILLKEIVTLNKHLNQNNKMLEDRVQERTQSLKQEIAERVEIQKKLARAKKMESLGMLAGGVAHDLNNVLSGIVSYPELLLMELPEGSKIRKPIETMKASGQRAAAIVQDLLTVARGVATPKETLDLNVLIGDYLNSPELKKLTYFHPAVTVETDLKADLLHVHASPIHIRKVVMNLVSNAAEAIDDGGSITISTRNRYIDSPLSGYDDVNIGEYAVLAVSDDGLGISADDLERIFEPFYTKKFMGRSGTGLGLAVVWNVVQDHNGYIDVTSDEKGTIFELYFPITREKVSPKDLSIPIEDLKGNGEAILVVDDVESQRQISCEMLRKLGYQTKAVASGEDAVDYLKRIR